MNYYNEIKNKIIKSEIYDRVKDYSKERNKVQTYYEIGKLLSEAGKDYGKNIIKKYSQKLMNEVGKKYNERNLRYMRKFYEVFTSIKLNPMGSKLSWSHYRELLSIKDPSEIIYYIMISEKNNLTKRELQNIIKNKEYNRLSKNTKNKIANEEDLIIYDLVPNPIIIQVKNKESEISEFALKSLILEKIDDFLFQLGIGFAYIGSEYKIKIGDRYNYIDLLLYNIEYNCYVVIELKVTELKKEHIGQIQIYMNYIDNHLKKMNQDKTIGIIICKRDNKYVIEYSSDKRILSREYELK